ncbi:MAG: hypothetical protein PF487_01515 [Bacteroidales bacterium]|nr:hypothetical protein [Bacteroidales bacterium]
MLFKFNVIKRDEILPIDYYCLFGFVVITTITSYWSIFYKVDLNANIILSSFSILIYIINYQELNKLIRKTLNIIRHYYSTTFIVILSIVILLILLLSLKQPDFYDTGLYHAQAIQWINKYKVIPGLGNLHSRFAFNSHMFIASALYNWTFIGDILKFDFVYFPINSFLVILISSRLIFNLFIAKNENKIEIFVFNLVILTLSLWFFRKTLSAPVPDTSTAILIIYSLLIFIKERNRSSEITMLIILCLVFFIPTFKLSALFVAGLIPFVFRINKFKTLKLIFLTGILILSPFIIRNIYLSGYVIYPFKSIDIFNFDWKIPIEKVVQESLSIKNWAKTAATGVVNSTEHIPFTKWFIPWLYALRIDTLILFILNLITPLVLIPMYYARKIKNKNLLIAVFVSLMNILFILYSAPDLRFAQGFLIFNAAFVLCLIFNIPFSLNLFIIKSNKLLILFILLITILTSTQAGIRIANFQVDNILIPIQIKKVDCETYIVNNVEVKIPLNGDQCFNEDLPCTPYINNKLCLRGENIIEGFKSR